MQDSPDIWTAADDAITAASASRGWYLYGITRNARQADGGAGLTVSEADDGEPLETLVSGDLLAIVRRVPLADFSPESLRARADDPTWIESVVRSHNAVIDNIHRTHTVLPAKFGSVYARAEDLQTALRDEAEGLRERLSWLDGCDEWGVRLYGDVATLRQRVDTEQSEVQRLRQELTSASPGRAYFLRRKLADELDNAAERLLDDLVGQAYERFARHAKAGQVSQRMAGSRINDDDERAEILRTAFLVPRVAADAFLQDVRAYAESQPGLSCEYSGPWAPYSFASQPEQAEEE